MAIEVSYDAESDFIRIKVTGDLDMEVLAQVAREVAQLASGHDCERVLSDFRDAELKMTQATIYRMPQFATEAGAERRVRRALVVSRDLKQYGFFETVSKNQAHNVRTFSDIEEARKWLLIKP